MARLQGDRAALYGAAQHWKKRCLLSDGSVLGAGAIWTIENADILIRDFVNKPDDGDRSFVEKLRDQLSGSSTSAIQLAAEMLWVMMLFPSNIRRETKTTLVTNVWNWSKTELRDPQHMLDIFQFDIGSGGPGYNNFRPFEFVLLIRFTRAFKKLELTARTELFDDAWHFARWFDEIEDATSRQLRHMILHLLFPDVFERISSRNDKKAVDSIFASEIASLKLTPDEREESPLGRDRRLFRIRTVLEAREPGAWLDFYETPSLRKRWIAEPAQGPTNYPQPRPIVRTQHRIWALGADHGASRWPQFRLEGIIAIGWDELGDLSQYKTLDDVRAAIKLTYNRSDNPINDTQACFQFANEISLGDEIYVKQGLTRVLGHGRVIGDYEFDDSRADYRSIRRVEWLHVGNWTLPEAISLPTKTLTDVTSVEALHTALAEAFKIVVKPGEDSYGVDDILRDAFLERAEVEHILTNLRRRKNVILQGAPGVGKTFLARRLAYALLGRQSPEHVQMVQFHQSYAYEDFIQGWRPSEKGGFHLRNGVFHEFCRRARGHPDQPYVFIIDEINRGNLSKVFGELLMLIEADKRGPASAIPLTYSESGTDTFYVPANLYIIGLMNTADRSLAMVDYALRRRFAFIDLRPAFTSPRFTETLTSQGVSVSVVKSIVSRITKINDEMITRERDLGHGFAIGHSFFCPSDRVTDSQRWYDMVVDDEIVPLLREYWFDKEKKVQEALRILKPDS